ncbi:MAG: chemotaxis protein CheW [Lachnospiraceae bacterium]|jgi:purine-binding chemotaxis protein CheW|nr:chemotaxis protein CheW [Lachnospiraceae bacterium]
MDDKNNIQNLEIAEDGKQYIVIKLGIEQYGIDIQYVDNIVRNQKITRVPKAQSYFKGVMNLRGEIIPVMSLRLKFGLDPDEYTNNTRIIIIKFNPQSAVGIIVDQVNEVVSLTDDQIDAIHSTDGNDVGTQYLSGVGKYNDTLISLLNIGAVIGEKDVG